MITNEIIQEKSRCPWDLIPANIAYSPTQIFSALVNHRMGTETPGKSGSDLALGDPLLPFFQKQVLVEIIFHI